MRFESQSYSQRSWSSERGSGGRLRPWRPGRRLSTTDYRDGGRWSGGYQERWSDRWRPRYDDRHGQGYRHDWREDDSVGYLPLSFFGDAGGVGPYPADFDNGGGGGFGFVGGSAGGFAGARASASARVSVSAFGGFRGRGGFHGGGHHGCGCR